MIISNRKSKRLTPNGSWYVKNIDGSSYVTNSRNYIESNDEEAKDSFRTEYYFNDSGLEIILDEIEFEAPYIHRDQAKITISDNLDELMGFLKEECVDVELDKIGVGEYLIYGNSITGRTPYKHIKKISADTNIDGVLIKKKDFEKIEITKTVQEEAKAIYCNIDEFFKDEKDIVKDAEVLLGLSGGLDSRVAGYFLAKNKYRITPIFVGKKTNKLGVHTYDAVISESLAESLNIDRPTFIDPTQMDEVARLKREIAKGLESSSNIFNNVGDSPILKTARYLANGSMGGELFGACVQGIRSDASKEELKKYLMSSVTMLPKFAGEKHYLIKILVKAGLLNKNRYKEIDKLRDIEIATKNHLSEYIDNWLEMNASKGCARRLYQIFLYEKLARGHRRGFFYSFNGDKITLPCFLRRSIVQRMMNWPPIFFDNKGVQRELMQLLGEAGQTRSQNIHDRTTGNLSRFKWLIRALERVVRGGGMNYQQFCKHRKLGKPMLQIAPESLVKYLEDSPTMREGLYKIASSIEQN